MDSNRSQAGLFAGLLEVEQRAIFIHHIFKGGKSYDSSGYH